MKNLLTLLTLFIGLGIANAQTKRTIVQGNHKSSISKYCALAIDKNNGFYYGFSYDYPTSEEAENKAKSECKAKGGNCSVVLSFSGAGCAVYRTIDGNVGTAYGWGIAKSKEAADAIATKEATKRSNGANPSKFVWACNSGSSELKIIKNESIQSKKTYKDSDGDEYEYSGDIKNNMPNGNGKAVYVKSGNQYIGQFVNGDMTGKGEFIFKSGTRYVGTFVKTSANGMMEVYLPTGSTYKGEMLNGELSGFGVYKFASGNKYEGYFKNDKRHGKGKSTMADGSYYEGDFVNDKMHGFGKLVEADGRINFEGQFANDNPVRK